CRLEMYIWSEAKGVFCEAVPALRALRDTLFFHAQSSYSLEFRSRKLWLTFPVFLLAANALHAEGTHTWEQSKFDDLSKGTPKGVAIRSNGGLELAPAFKPVSTTPSTYIWSIATDSSGVIYAATGGPARVYRITPAGQSTPIFAPQEQQVQSILCDKKCGS